MQKSQITLTMAVAAMVALMVGLMGTTTAGAQSAEDSIEQLEAGQVIFESNCAGCHGNDGAGSATGRPLTSIAIQEPDRSVHFTSVKDGKGSMPAYADRLSDDEIDSAISYVRLTFVGEEAQSGAADGDTASDGDTTSDDAVTTTEESAEVEELAVTGESSSLLLVIGASLLIAGFLFVQARRELS